MRLAELTPPADLPAPDARIPALAVRFAVLLLGALLSLDVCGISGWLGLGVVLSLLAAVAPEYLFAWLLILYLAISESTAHNALTWEFLVLLAGVQLLHVLASLTVGLPWRTWLQPAVFERPLRRVLVTQIPVQLLAVLALLLLGPDAHGHRPVTVVEFTVVGSAALMLLALLLLRRRFEDRAH